MSQSQPQSKSKLEQWQWENATTGAAAGFTTVAAMYPLDVICTRFQVNDGLVSTLPSYKTRLTLFSPLLAWRVSEGFMQASIPQLLGQLFHGVYISSSMIEQNKGILKTRKGSLVLVFILLLLQKLELCNNHEG
ncbi:hypothetical protein CMV_022827 [Castanea mollissima]|uniref:Mitochondrial carrier protein n=1 Tax=Castanea mollissima TaxID=60419 RepID=A0A8J4VJX4_9ROSI|nr:hypothetical protein CMV_022827 [Castanea mollissima]